MKNKNRRLTLLTSCAMLFFSASLVAGCSGANSQAFASVKLEFSELQMSVGESKQIRVSVTKGYEGTVRWFSSNENVVLMRDGYAFAVGVGSAKVTAAFAGGYADVNITVVEGEEGGGTVDRLSISPKSKTIAPGKTFKISYSIYPTDSTVTFASGNTAVATVDASGNVTAVSNGSTNITVTGSNGKVAVCAVTVSEESGGGDSSGRDIAVETNLNYTGVALRVGAPKNQVAWMNSILGEFNSFTGSSISFTVSEFEEGDGVSNLPTAESAPDIFPYASDQTLSFYQLGALSNVSRSDGNWIKENMGQDAYNAARLQSLVGIPFTSDNGAVMFYDKSVVSDPSQIDTLDELFTLADEKGLEVNIPYGNGFYCAPILQTYAGGTSLYTLTPTDRSYNATSTFASDEGLQGAKLLKRIINESTIRNVATVPGKNDVLATVVDVSKVASFKNEMGDKYATAPLPLVTENGPRLGSYLGYKFYGVNNTLSAANKTIAFNVAKFLASEYVQAKRFDTYKAKPTILDLEDYAISESHIQSLTTQSQNNGTILLTACGLELWSETATATQSIKALGANPSDEEYMEILRVLDGALER